MNRYKKEKKPKQQMSETPKGSTLERQRDMDAPYSYGTDLNAAKERREDVEIRAQIKARREAITPFRKDKTIGRKEIEEIIKNGTPEERAALTISDYDLNKSYGTLQRLTEKNRKQLRANVDESPEEDRNAYFYYLRTYDTMNRYYMRLRTYIKAYQAEVALLTSLITQWESYDREAEACSRQLSRAHDPKATITHDDGSTETIDIDLGEFKEMLKDLILRTHTEWEDATLIFDETTKTFRADVDGEGKLYEDIVKQAKDTQEALSRLKAAIEVVEGYIHDEADLFVEPSRMESSIEMVLGENYARTYGGSLKYFRSELNDRKDKGEEITPEDEKRAVYPDYYEIEPNFETMDALRGELINMTI